MNPAVRTVETTRRPVVATAEEEDPVVEAPVVEAPEVDTLEDHVLAEITGPEEKDTAVEAVTQVVQDTVEPALV